MSKSDPPPSSAAGPPVGGGSGGYVIAALVLAAAVAFMLYSRCSGEPATANKPSAAKTAPKPPPPPTPVPEFAPPPPPEKDAGAEASASVAPQPRVAPTKKASSASGGGACSKCGQGMASSALKSAVGQTANLARGCYHKALRGGGGEGTLTVSVSVGAGGKLCGVNASGNVGNAELKQCVLSKFRSRSYPAPKEGCVIINVPIAFRTTQ